MKKKISENPHDYYMPCIKIMLLFFVIFIFFSVSCCLAQSVDSEVTAEQDSAKTENIEEAKTENIEEAKTENNEEARIEDNEEAKIEDNEEAMVKGSVEEAMMEARDEVTMELPKDEYHYYPLGKRDPFYSKMLVEKKKAEPNKKIFGVQRYELAELKLVGIIWGELGRKGVVETPEGKSYLIKVGTLIGKKDGVVKAITNQEVVIQEFVSDYLGNRIENVSILKIQRKEQEQ